VITVLCTTPNEEEAQNIAKTLVMEHLASCVNRIPQVTSHYIYEGEYYEEREVLLVIKSDEIVFEKLKKRIKALHSYDVPEIIALDVKDGDEAYLAWHKKMILNGSI
jgi:periplasmic divalent cation tolerance protein